MPVRTFGGMLGVLGVLLACGAFTRVARAEAAPAVDLRDFRAPTHPEGLLYLEPTATPDAGEWNAGAWVSYGYRPLVLFDPVTGEKSAIIRHQLSLELVAGFGLGEHLALGLALPSVLYQTGETPPPTLPAQVPPATALGNLAVDGRATLLERDRQTILGLAVLARLALPTGNTSSYIAESTLKSEFRLLGELDVLGSFVRASVGARVRGEERQFAGKTFGHDLTWGLGLHVKPQTLGVDRAGRWLVALEGHGAVALAPEFAAPELSPAALGLAARRTFGEAFGVLGTELPLDRALGLSRVRAFVSAGYAPRPHDTDGDGLDDADDACPDRAEDRDGFEDHDGCPEVDNDRDGVPDAEDRCPGSIEDLDGFEDQDGCDDPDDDHDGTPDVRDACRNEPGPAAQDPKRNGCPERDRDMDGIPDPRDRCPTRAEDRDGFEDEDGCPDPDDDHDGIRDAVDRCPRAAGPARSDPELDGCPSPDVDGDATEGDADRCPEEPEDYDGEADDDGCPDADPAGKPAPPLALLSPVKDGPHNLRWQLRYQGKLDFTSDNGSEALATGSLPIVRAVAALLNRNPSMVLMVAVRPLGNRRDSEQQALTRSFALVNALRGLTHRDEVAETVSWSAVRRVRGAAQADGLGFLVLSPESARPGATTASERTGPP